MPKKILDIDNDATYYYSIISDYTILFDRDTRQLQRLKNLKCDQEELEAAMRIVLIMRHGIRPDRLVKLVKSSIR